MSFLPIVNIAEVREATDKPKFGRVISNKDPKMLGRVKVQIPGIFDGTEDALPWIRRKMDTVFCGLNCEVFDVPEEGSVVQVQWDYDKETPTYTGAPYNMGHQSMAFTENYPYQGGIVFGDIVIKFDKSCNMVHVDTGACQFALDGLGRAAISAKTIDLIADHEVMINAPRTVFNGDVSIDGGLKASHAASGVLGLYKVGTVIGGVVTNIS